MTKRPRVLHWVLLALVAAGAGTWWLASRDVAPRTTLPPSSDPLAGTAARAPSIEPPAAVPRQPDLPPMPSPDLTLRDALPSLQSRADAGDSLAACRLGVELLRCAALRSYPPGHDESMAQQQAEQEAGGNRAGADRIAMGRALHAQLRDACATVPAALVDRAHHYVRQAALAGEPEAMVRYAAGQTITSGLVGFGYVTRPGFDQWRREARPVLMRAIDDGVPEAALLLVMAQARDGGLLGMLLPRDEVEASASLSLARELFGDISAVPPFAPGPGRPATPVLDPDKAAAAAQMAADWHARGYGGRRLELADSTASLHSLHLPWGWDSHEGMPGKPRAVPCTDAVEANP
jgi:TPR repeat protein